MTTSDPATSGEARLEGRTIYRKPLLLTNPTSYCPGCGHGIVHRLVAEVLEEMDLGAKTILVGSVGCSVFAYDYLGLDSVESPHGRAAAVATGVKRYRPDRVVFTYQGDGDLAAIGTAEIIHAAARGERFTTIFVNNGIYGMTGGQMAPTTLPGQKTTSSPLGRDVQTQGYPLPVTEMLSLLSGVQYAARTSVADPGHVGKAKQAIKRAFEIQLEDKGFSIVEVLSTCPVGWGVTPTQAMDRLRDTVMEAYPVGTFVDRPRGIAPGLPKPGGPHRSIMEGF
jgi:2-oxoglutarate ferredoxin oxidoreductase subunit beta